MKIIRTASGGNKIKISEKEWNLIGHKAGWIKESQFEFDHRDPKNYAPGQTPYTDEQWGKVRKMIKDDAHSSDFKDGYSEELPVSDDNLGVKPDKSVAMEQPKNAKSTVYNGFLITVEPSGQPSLFDTKIDGKLIPLKINHGDKWDGFGVMNAIDRGKKAIERAIVENYDAIMDSLGRER